MIKGKINLEEKDREQKELEAVIERAGAGSHMVFRSNKKNDELFVDEL